VAPPHPERLAEAEASGEDEAGQLSEVVTASELISVEDVEPLSDLGRRHGLGRPVSVELEGRGVAHRVERKAALPHEPLRTETLSGVGFELDVLWLLHLASADIQARPEVSARGSDFDFSAIILDRRIPVEVKAKDDSTPFTPRTVTKTLKGAARQMPKGEQGVIFIRIPFSWVNKAIEDEYSEAVAEGVRQTTRVGAVITAIDKPHYTDERLGNVTRHFDYFRHDACAESIWTFAMMLKQAWDADWTIMAPPSPF